MANWFYFIMCNIEAAYKVEKDYAEDYPEMDEQVEDIDPGWDDEENGGDDDADYNDEYDDEEYDDDEQPDQGITRFDNDW